MKCFCISTRQQLWSFLRIIVAVALVTGFIACESTTEPPLPPPPFCKQSINNLVECAGEIPPPPPPSHPLLKKFKTDSIDIATGDQFECVLKQYELTENFDEIVAFRPNVPVVWPGALVQGKTIASGVPAIIPLDRRSITVTADIPFFPEGSAVVDDPKYSTVKSAIDRLLLQIVDNASVAAQFSYTEIEAHSREQAAMQAGVSTKWFGDWRFSYDETREQRSVFVKFIQVYYTIAVDEPAGPDDVFAPSVKVEDLERYVGPGNPPLYISSVTYGRILMLKMTSTYEFDDMKAAIKPIFWEEGLTSAQQEILEKSSFQLLVLGGNAEAAIDSIKNGEITGIIQSGKKWSKESPGFPISYTVKHLIDNSLAMLGETTEYWTTECSVKQQKIEVSLDSIKIVHDCEKNGQGKFYYDFEITSGDSIVTLAKRSSDNPFKKSDGEIIEINQSIVLRKLNQSGESFTLGGKVREKDKTAADPFNRDKRLKWEPGHTFSWDDNQWNPGQYAQLLEHNSNNCKVIVHYSVTLLP